MPTASSASLSHAQWDGTYHGGLIPQGRKKAWYGKRRPCLGSVVRAGAGPRGRPSVDGPRGQAQVHRLRRLPPQEAGAAGMGAIQGQRASAVARPCGGRQRNVHGARCGARGDAVATGGGEAEPRRASSKPQEPRDAQGSDEPGACSRRHNAPWQP